MDDLNDHGFCYSVGMHQLEKHLRSCILFWRLGCLFSPGIFGVTLPDVNMRVDDLILWFLSGECGSAENPPHKTSACEFARHIDPHESKWRVYYESSCGQLSATFFLK